MTFSDPYIGENCETTEYPQKAYSFLPPFVWSNNQKLNLCYIWYWLSYIYCIFHCSGIYMKKLKPNWTLAQVIYCTFRDNRTWQHGIIICHYLVCYYINWKGNRPHACVFLFFFFLEVVSVWCDLWPSTLTNERQNKALWNKVSITDKSKASFRFIIVVWPQPHTHFQLTRDRKSVV